MRTARRLAVPHVALLAVLAFAGCSGDAPEGDGDPRFQATQETGFIVGVVVDQTVTPLAGANVTLHSQPPRHALTDAEGTFGFDALPPGTYRIEASKPGFAGAQTVAEVVAGEDEPHALRIALTFDPGLVPFTQTYVFEGFLECSFYLHTVGYFAACAAGPIGNSLLCSETGVCLGNNVTNDRIYTFIPVEGTPDWVQGEMVWESTQSFGSELTFYLAAGTKEQVDGGGYEQDMNVTTGPSPVLVTVNGTELEDEKVGTEMGLVPHVVAAAYQPTVQCLPEVGCEGVGFAAEQRFTIFLHSFYNHVPPAGWRFSADGSLPPPA